MLLWLVAHPASGIRTVADLRGTSRSRTRLVHARDVLYIGRGPALGIALEGAVKKEISYIHAEG